MKSRLLGGAALVIAVAVSASAWANPKNSFSDWNWTYVDSYANANAGDYGGGYYGYNSSYDGEQVGNGNVAHEGDNKAKAISESFNKSIEGVEVSELSSYSTGYIYQYSYWYDNYVEWGNAEANAGSGGTNSGLFQASASNGVGNATTQGQSIAAGAEVSFE
jgi:hypothetical protein